MDGIPQTPELTDGPTSKADQLIKLELISFVYIKIQRNFLFYWMSNYHLHIPAVTSLEYPGLRYGLLLTFESWDTRS